MKRKCLKKLVFFPNMIVVTVITKITLFSLTMRNKNNAIFSVFFSFSSSLYLKPHFSIRSLEALVPILEKKKQFEYFMTDKSL